MKNAKIEKNQMRHFGWFLNNVLLPEKNWELGLRTNERSFHEHLITLRVLYDTPGAWSLAFKWANFTDDRKKLSKPIESIAAACRKRKVKVLLCFEVSKRINGRKFLISQSFLLFVAAAKAAQGMTYPLSRPFWVIIHHLHFDIPTPQVVKLVQK